MATRSTISIRNADGTYTGIYAHWDGYLSHNGEILRQHYTDEAKIRQLMALGDISVLAEEIGEKHAWRNPHDIGTFEHDEWQAQYGRWCVSYGRDRGDPDCEARQYASLEHLVEAIGQEYDYVWEDAGWKVRCCATDGKFVPLEEARRLEEEAEEC